MTPQELLNHCDSGRLWTQAPSETPGFDVADGGLHARLLVGAKVPIRQMAQNARQLDEVLAQARVTLLKEQTTVEQGSGSSVLGGPLHTLHHFMRSYAGKPLAYTTTRLRPAPLA